MMTTRIRTLALTLIVLFAGLTFASHAQQGPPGQQGQGQPPPAKPGQQPPDQQRPIFRAGVNFVRVDVIVTDKKGDPVNDLQAADFDVQEDGKPQKIETFKLIKMDTTAEAVSEPSPRPIRTQFDEESEAARDDVRLYAIFLDDYHVRRESSMVVRDPLSRFIQMRLAPQDMVGIMYPLTPISDVFLTRDRDATVSAIQQFDGRKYDYRPRNAIEMSYSHYPAATVERIRNQVTLSALRSLIVHLGGLREGRKAIILVSEGYTNLLPPQLRDPIADMPGLNNPARRNPTVGENDPNEDRSAWLANVDMQRDLRDVYDDANRQNVAIYALDPRGLAVNEFNLGENVGPEQDRAMLQSTIDTLRTLSDQTDGRAIVNRNDLDGGLRQVVRDSSAYYLLGYNSSGAPADGKFHEIKVRVKRPGVQVRGRKGYWALTADERARALAPPKPALAAPVQQALVAINDPGHGHLIRSWLGMSRGENGKTRITFVWEAIPPAAGTTRPPEPQRVSLVAAGANGDYFRGRVPETAAATPPPADPAATSVPAAKPGSRVTFEAEPGRMQLRLAVEGARAEVLDTDVREIVVPDLTVPQLTLSTPVIYRARTARDFKAIASDPAAVPAASREFSRTERLLIRFDVYAPGNATLAPTARLLNRGGMPMTTVAVQAVAGDTKSYTIDLPLSGLAAGEYVLEITTKGESGEATQMVGMRITS
jgi:VWFA-related protein